MKPRSQLPPVVALLVGAALLVLTESGAWCASFHFVALGDSRGDSCSEPIDAPVLSALVAKILALEPRPAFVLFAGDMVRGPYWFDFGHSPSLAEQLRMWQRAVRPLKEAGIRVWAVPGNHEIGGLWAASRQQACRLVLGRLQYAVSYEGTWIIALNTDRAGHGQSADLAWLEAQLGRARAAGAEHIFVLGHEPAYPVAWGRGLKNATGFWRLLARYGADAYICGHEHLYCRQTRGGVVQVTTGGAGAPLQGADGPKEGDFNLTLWRVDGPRVAVEALGMDAATKAWRRIDAFHYLKEEPGRPAVARRPAAVPCPGGSGA